jgi:methylated-DNA-protein-cysteine methyltransferase-like protein
VNAISGTRYPFEAFAVNAKYRYGRLRQTARSTVIEPAKPRRGALQHAINARVSRYMTHQPFTDRVVEAIRSIPPGRVATYGQIAAMAGNRRAARQVARVLHACSHTRGLPWHRVVNREGRIALPASRGYEDQRRLLQSEGVGFDTADRIDLERFLWRPDRA